MASHSAIAERVRTALAQYLKQDPATIELHHTLRDDLGLDSMATIELLFQIEEVFDLQIPDEDLQQLATVADVIAYVEGKVRASAPRRTVTRGAKRSPPKRKG